MTALSRPSFFAAALPVNRPFPARHSSFSSPKILMRIRLLIAAFAGILGPLAISNVGFAAPGEEAKAPPAPAAPAQLDVFVSTGDNHFLGSSLPIDSEESIGATFDLFQRANHARRIYWRGLEEAAWIATMHARPENPRYYSLWKWMEWLYANVKPDETAVKAAHDRGLEIWGVGTLWDWGSPADTPTFGDYPFPFESKLKLEHPEWASVDRHGARKQGGPIELAYPAARKALVELHVQEAVKAGYDGITFLTYAENYSMRFQDEFGFSDPVVEDFKKQHRVDLRIENFKRGASREDWLRLRGSYLTAYLRELKTELKKHGIKLGMILNGNDIHASLAWNVPELMPTAGAQYMDVETWVREGLVDNLVVYGNCYRLAQWKAVEDLSFLCRQTGVEVSFMTSSPFDESWKPLCDRGVAAVLSVSDDAQHLGRSFIPEQSAEALKGDDLWKRLRALGEVSDGKLSAKLEDIAPLAKSKNLIERRMALRAMGKLGEGTVAEAAPFIAAEAAPLLEQGLNDEENGVRCAAALAIGDTHHADSWKPVLDAIEKHGNHMLIECAIIALRKMKPFPAAALADVVKTSKNPALRMVAMRALIPQATIELQPVIRAAMLDPDRFTAFAAAEAMGNIRKTNGGVMPLISTLSNPDPAVAARAAVSLGVIAARNEKEAASVRERMIAALKLDFERFGEGCIRSDADWGYRPVGNALRAFGEDGEAALRQLRDQRVDMKLADLAWRVLDLHQEPNTFSEVTAKENDEAYARRPRLENPAANGQPTGSAGQPTAAAAAPGRNLHVDPANGDDKNDGVDKPFKTIAPAIRMAQPGDTVHLAPATYYESVDLTNKHGELGRPITVDGHGAVLDGSEPVTSKEWDQVSPGLYRKQNLIHRIDDAVIQRWFMLWNGRMNHMNRTSKGPRAPLKKPADLQPDEWTYAQDEDAFYVRLKPGQDLDAANIRYPARSAGVIESISGSHLTVRNVTSTHVYNDGCNIHGMTRDCHFQNITSIECGDDGFSAHDDCQCEIDGFVSIGNSTGFADVGSSVTHYRNIHIQDCLGIDMMVEGDGEHSITNGVVLSSASTPLALGPETGGGQRDCAFILENVLFRRVGAPADLRVNKGASLDATRCTFLSTSFLNAGGSVSLDHCVLGGDPKSSITLRKDSRWHGVNNLYDLLALRADQTSFTPETFGDFQKLTGSEAGSQWLELPWEKGRFLKPLPEGLGADEETLKKLGLTRLYSSTCAP
jgi:hypothetical protein